MECKTRSDWRAMDRAPEADRISGILVRLTVGGSRYLHVRLSSDGAIERGGQGEKGFDGTLEDRDLFAGIRRNLSPQLLRWAGQSWADPSPRGDACEIVIAFREPGGRETVTSWKYGSESPEPPEEIRGFVLSVVEATNPWYRRQIEARQQARRRPDAVWRLVPLVRAGDVNAEVTS